MDAAWLTVPYFYTQGMPAIDGVNHRAEELTHKWGTGRLRLLVPNELREKFDSQRARLNTAITAGTIADLKAECERMLRAWDALDRKAAEIGATQIEPDAWEVVL